MATDKVNFYNLAIMLIIISYGAFALYSALGHPPPAVTRLFYSTPTNALFGILLFLYIKEGQWGMALLLGIITIYNGAQTYLALGREGFHGSPMNADLKEKGDSPVGKARENYISGIYDFTGHLAYEQLPIVPP